MNPNKSWIRDGDQGAQHPVIREVLGLGYSIEYQFLADPRYLEFTVWIDGKPAGSATYVIDKASGELKTEDIAIFEEHRRRKVATAIMLCAMKLTGCKPVPASSQTDDGRAWWGQPNRPW